MQIQITHDQCYCSFGDGIVYEFVPQKGFYASYPCLKCSFSRSNNMGSPTLKCSIVPCQKGLRSDKKDGFWQISKTIDYQQFTKMLKNGG